jgi:microcystin-dependent protein
MARREYQAGKPTTLSAPFNIGDPSFSITSSSNWPDGAEGYNFWVTIDAGTAQEERVLCSSRTSSVVTVASGGRGSDGTTESNHTQGATIWPSWSATDADEANAHVNATTAVHGLGSGVAVVGTTATQTLTNKTLTSPKINENVAVTATATEINILDGLTASTAELNLLDGVTATTTELNYVDGVTSSIQSQFNNLVTVPSGVINAFAGTAASVPTGWLLCDGSSFSSSTYPTLATIVGDAYAAHSGTTYYLPNLKGKIPVGRDSAQTEFDTLGETGGAKTVTLTEAQMPVHTHSLNPGQVVGGSGSGGTNNYAPTGNNPTANTSITSAGGSGGVTQAHENLQPYVVVNYIIKT